jgi:hypothetical protein
MKGKILGLLFALTFLVKYSDSCAQVTVKTNEQGTQILDSLSGKGFIYQTIREKPDVKLSREQAIKYLQVKYRNSNWNDPTDPLRKAIGQLIYFASNNPFDSTRYFLERYSFDSINIPWDRFYVWDTLKIKIPVIPPPRITMALDTISKPDTLLKKNINDTVNPLIINKFQNIQGIPDKPLMGLKDTIILVATDTLSEVTSSKSGFPFRHYSWPYESDSITAAINSLVGYVEERDSSIINFSGVSKGLIPVWINSQSGHLVRFWLHNEAADSVTIWIGNISRNTFGLYLEDGIIFRRPTKQSNFSDAQLNMKVINSKTLQEINKIAVKPKYWKFRSETSFTFSQTALTNWVKGGENSVSTALDITGFADYNNKQKKLLSYNFMRLKYGLLASGKPFTIRKNLDLLETNSKLNHKAFGKFDFSAIMLFKTQITKGYNYPNDSVPVSKFLNPAILTLGFGLDYKPNKTTSLNFSPLSYKGTFVPDTAHIDQTKYGVTKDKRSLNEPGVSFMITNEYKPFKTITIINRLQLFTNYIHNPQNIDVDWEMIASAKLNWFTDVRFNTHLIYDDDTKTPLYDKNDKPVMEGGVQKKTARVQFKEILGFSLIFKF